MKTILLSHKKLFIGCIIAFLLMMLIPTLAFANAPDTFQDDEGNENQYILEKAVTGDKQANEKIKDNIKTTVSSVLNVNTNSSTDKVAYTCYDSSNNSFTYYYDDKYNQRSSTTGYQCWQYDLNNNKRPWLDSKYNDIIWDCKNIIVDESMHDANIMNCSHLFAELINAKAAPQGLFYLQTSSVTDMQYMFNNYGEACTTISTAPDCSTFDTSNVKSMDYMFAGYGAHSVYLTAVPNVSSFNTVNLEHTYCMFASYAEQSIKTLAPLDISNWNVSKLATCEFMFADYNRNAPNNNNPPAKILSTDWTNTTPNLLLRHTMDMFRGANVPNYIQSDEDVNNHNACKACDISRGGYWYVLTNPLF